uniref:Uncharacterized protein n=1 Tax=Glossina brevipalpis TaxID=37001 RepID=A0A1A9WJQ5_9MUSC
MEMRSTNDLIAAANASTDGADDFEKLKAEREKQRQERQKQKFARTVSTAPGVENAPATIVPVVAAVIPASTTLTTTDELPRTDLLPVVASNVNLPTTSTESAVE